MYIIYITTYKIQFVMKYNFYKSPIHGIGCIANQDIQKGEIINEEPFFKFKKDMTNPVLNDYYWNYRGEKYIINGLGNYANHSYDNNCKPLFSNEIFTTKLIPFVATKLIKKNDEILNNYGTSYWNKRSHLKMDGSSTNSNKILQSSYATKNEINSMNYSYINRNHAFNFYPSKNYDN